ncbi:MAG: hypothetical protein ISS82_05010 [Nanoarchaeota archaeon]|nr:hypothetical protein [Nanoarchaeota archaeon]
MFPFNIFKKKKKLQDLPIENIPQDIPQQQFNEPQENLSDDLINSKLDTINAKLDNIEMRLKKIEELAKP